MGPHVSRHEQRRPVDDLGEVIETLDTRGVPGGSWPWRGRGRHARADRGARGQKVRPGRALEVRTSRERPPQPAAADLATVSFYRVAAQPVPLEQLWNSVDAVRALCEGVVGTVILDADA